MTDKLVERLAILIRDGVEVTVHPDEPCSYDYEVDAYNVAETIAKEIERLREAGGLLWAALGFYRDDMPAEAVKRFQEIAEQLHPARTALESKG